MMAKLPRFKLTGIASATTYKFRVANSPHGEWACCTVNDDTSALMVTSDWGDWSHTWCNPAFGQAVDLTDFLSGCSPDYIADKLSTNYGRVFCGEKTEKYICAELRKMRENFEISKETYKQAVEEVKSLRDYHDNEQMYQERLWDIRDDNGNEMFSEPWHLLQSDYEHKYLVLLKGIIPALQVACKKTAAQRRKMVPAVQEAATSDRV